MAVNTPTQEKSKASKEDFTSDQEVRWCVGCGDYSILAQMKKVLAELKLPREETVFVSGIGCSSRFPYYLNTYGFHSIHGRAPAVATGIKLANPGLSVWIVTGDGDGLSIGANHLFHLFRRNLDVNLILFNNQIYGLTKGQYSPTSPIGKQTKSSPYGSLEAPVNPISFALGSSCTFVARTMDRDPKHMVEIFKRAHAHKGCSFVEVYQNCNIYNDGAFFHMTEQEARPENVVYLKHDSSLIYGKERDKGISLNGFNFETVQLGNGMDEKDLFRHDEHQADPGYAFMLSRMTENPDLPTPVGVFRSIEQDAFDSLFHQQLHDVTERRGKGDLKKLLVTGDTWKVN
jgi:2-oxoglutarate ferredoxin oxidoreductase subunit beta